MSASESTERRLADALTECERLREENERLRERLEPLQIKPSSTPLSLQSATTADGIITVKSSPEEKVNIFRSLFRGREDVYALRWEVHADAGYLGVEKRTEIVALERKIDWQIARKRGPVRAMAEGAEKATVKAGEKIKASVRAFVEHPFHILKNLFRPGKVRYRGLAKNGHQLYTLFGLANVVIGARQACRAGEKAAQPPQRKRSGL